MKKLVLLFVACALGATACSHLREPTDAQLTTLLQKSEPALPGAGAMLDVRSLNCLRVWSGDAALLNGLAASVASDEGKTACRTTLDARLGDAARNPDKFTLAEVSAPKVVRRALALQQAQALANIANPASRAIPPALMHRAAPAPVPNTGSPFEPADPAARLGLAGTQLHEAQDLCLQVQQAATAPNAKDNLKRFGAFCVNNLRRLQSTLERSAKNGRTDQQIAQMAVSAQNMATIARNLLAGGGK